MYTGPHGMKIRVFGSLRHAARRLVPFPPRCFHLLFFARQAGQNWACIAPHAEFCWPCQLPALSTESSFSKGQMSPGQNTSNCRQQRHSRTFQQNQLQIITATGSPHHKPNNMSHSSTSATCHWNNTTITECVKWLKAL